MQLLAHRTIGDNDLLVHWCNTCCNIRHSAIIFYSPKNCLSKFCLGRFNKKIVFTRVLGISLV